MRYRHFTASVLVIASSLLIACDRGSDSPLSPAAAQSLNIQDIVTSASTSGSQGTLRGGTAPSPSGGPTITATGNRAVINGGTLSVTIQAAAAFTDIYLFVGGKTLGLSVEAAGGIGGHYAVHLPSSQTSATVVLALPQTIPLPEFEVLFAVATPTGTVGPYTGLTTTVTQVGTGDVQVTLSWDADSDTDLHVVDPSGEEVYYAHRQSASGGQLDLDSNAGCALDHVRNENITWPLGGAPRGVYTVRVDYWSSCDVAQTNYTVLIHNGSDAQIFSGSFTGSGDSGGLGSGRLIGMFERLIGPTAVRIGLPSRDEALERGAKHVQIPFRR